MPNLLQASVFEPPFGQQLAPALFVDTVCMLSGHLANVSPLAY